MEEYLKEWNLYLKKNEYEKTNKQQNIWIPGIYHRWLSVIVEPDAGAEDGKGEVTELWGPCRGAPGVPKREKERKTKQQHNQACGHWPHLHSMNGVFELSVPPLH